MPLAYRIVKSRHVATAWTGEGAAKFGGRWNSRGVRVVYCAQSLALAALEMLVQLDSPALLDHYHWASIQIESDHIVDSDPAGLPPGWNRSPAPAAVRRIGDEWIESGRSVALRVPSAVIAGEHNILLNPDHPEFASLVRSHFTSLRFDQRLRRRRPS